MYSSVRRLSPARPSEERPVVSGAPRIAPQKNSDEHVFGSGVPPCQHRIPHKALAMLHRFAA